MLTAAIDNYFDEGNIVNHFQQVSDTMLDEFIRESRPALVVFGPNSSGKTSFIQRFLGIGSILPSDIGPVTARIAQLTYASGEQACFRVYTAPDKTSVQCEGDLSSFFKNQSEINWEGIKKVLLPHVKRPGDIGVNSPEFNEWARCLVEISLPSNILSFGIDIYDTPGFLSDNREPILTENLHDLVKCIKPTLVFLYDNATISDTDKNCFLAMKNALGSMERVPVFFLNTKADCMSIANDYLLDDDPENVPIDLFRDTLREKRQHCYELLLRRREMCNEALGSLPDLVDQCICFDICTVPGNFDPWEIYANLINTISFRRLVEFAVETYSTPIIGLAKDMLATVDDYFDLTASAAVRLPHQWDTLRDEANEWGRRFFDEYEKKLPTLIDDLLGNILSLLDELKPEIARNAALIIRTDDPINTLLRDNCKTVQNYVQVAVQERVIKVAANKVIIKGRDEVKKSIADHFHRQHGLRKNELLTVAQRHVLSEISAETLQHTSLFYTFIDNIVKLPMRFIGFWRILPTRLSAYQRDIYNRYIRDKIADGQDNIYGLLEAMDAYATLSTETNRRAFASHCLTKIEDKLKQQKSQFRLNLTAWIGEQRNAFQQNIKSTYKYIKEHLSDQQKIYTVISQFSGLFARIEYQLLAAVELAKRGGVVPTIEERIDQGGFYSIHAARWGTDNNLIVKKLLDSSEENEQIAALEAHYHRVVTRLCPDYVVPLLHLYENNVNDSRQELWFIMPRYRRSLQKYLREHINTISFEKVINFALTIAKVLAEFHRLEIAHRDLKTSNIMLDDHEQCYIIDFGTVKVGLLNRTFLGTFPLPPEIIAAHSKECTEFVTYDGAAADIYSFGLILYEMLPKSSYERLDSDSLSHLDQLLSSYSASDCATREYIAEIRACLDRKPTNRPTASHLVSKLTDIQKRTEIKLCHVCMECERTLRFIPCRHKMMCTGCWQRWCQQSLHGNNRCILCNVKVADHIQDNVNATYYAS